MACCLGRRFAGSDVYTALPSLCEARSQGSIKAASVSSSDNHRLSTAPRLFLQAFITQIFPIGTYSYVHRSDFVLTTLKATRLDHSIAMPGFDFSNYNRNAALHARGVPLPKATSTGTTIVGCIYENGVVVSATLPNSILTLLAHSI